MSLITIQNLRDWFDLISDVKDAKLTFALDEAEISLREWIGADAYDAVQDEDEDITAKSLRKAEAHLAVYHLLINAGMRLRRNGLVKQEQDTGGSATNNVTSQFYTPKEIKEFADYHYGEAETKAKPYSLSAATPVSAGSIPVRPWWAQ